MGRRKVSRNVYFAPQMAEALQARSKASGVPVSEIMRQAVEAHLRTPYFDLATARLVTPENTPVTPDLVEASRWALQFIEDCGIRVSTLTDSLRAALAKTEGRV